MPLDPQKKARLEQERKQKVQEQLDNLKLLINTHQNNPQELYKVVNTNLKSYKPDALEQAYQYMRGNDYPADSTLVVGKLFHTRMIGEVKVNSALKDEGLKQGGLAEGKRVKKNAPNKLKGDKTILLKKGSPRAGSEGEEVCEYYGSSLAMAMMGSKLSPKFRLHAQGEEKYVASTFINGFKTFKDGASKDGAKGFGRFLAREFIIGNYDIHSGNAGITEINGERHWTGIDDGRAISYNIDCNWRAKKIERLNQPQTLDKFISRAKDQKLYTGDLFKGAEFACDLNAAVKDIDIDIMRHILQESTKNLKKLYSDDFLLNGNIESELCERMGLNRPLTENLVKDTIIRNITSRKQELQDMASAEAQKVLKEAIENNDIKTIKYMAQHMPEMTIEEKSPLKYAVSVGKIDSAIRMLKEGFAIKENEVDHNTAIIIKGNNYPWSSNGTQNDQLRMAIIGDNSKIPEDVLRSKPSLLYLAIETSQKELVKQLVDQGYKLKSSELNMYNAEKEAQGIKLSLMGKYFGWYNEADKATLTKLTKPQDNVLRQSTPITAQQSDAHDVIPDEKPLIAAGQTGGSHRFVNRLKQNSQVRPAKSSTWRGRGQKSQTSGTVL
jgi:hypothetical protein